MAGRSRFAILRVLTYRVHWMNPGSFMSNRGTSIETPCAVPGRNAMRFSERIRAEIPTWRNAARLVATQFAAGLIWLAASAVHFQNGELVAPLQRAAALILVAGIGVDWRYFTRRRLRSHVPEQGGFLLVQAVALLSAAALSAGISLFSWNEMTLIQGTLLLAAVSASVGVYVSEERPSWPGSFVAIRFFGTAMLLGTTGGAALSGWMQPRLAPALAVMATGIRTALFIWELAALRAALRSPESPLHDSARAAVTSFAGVLEARRGLFVVSTVLSLMAMANSGKLGAVWGTLACLATVSSQLLERYLFFAAADGNPPGV